MARTSVRPRRAALSFGAASAVANALGYLLTVVLARGLDPDSFGAMGALLSLGILGTIPATAVQLSIARQASDALTRGTRLATRSALWFGTRVGGGLALVFVAGAVPAASYLHLRSALSVVLVGLILVPMVVTAGISGLLLGEERLGALAVVTMASAAARVGSAALAVALGAGVSGILLGMCVGAGAAAVAATALSGRGGPDRLRIRGTTALASRSTVLLTAFFLLTNLDVPIARHHLGGPESGSYVLASLFAKVCLWGPQFLAVVAYPRMHRVGGRTTTWGVMGLTATIGAVVAVSAVPLGDTMVTLVAHRSDPVAAQAAPWFALLGTTWAVLNVLVLNEIARQRSARSSWWLWSAVGVLVVALSAGSTPPDTVRGVVSVTLAVAVAAVAVGGVRLAASGPSGSGFRHTVRAPTEEDLAQGDEDLRTRNEPPGQAIGRAEHAALDHQE